MELIKLKLKGNFYIQEFVSPWWMDTAKNGYHVIAGMNLNASAMIEGTQYMRDNFAVPITINNWHSKGVYSESCLRTPHPVSDQIFAWFSGHMFWNCADMKFKNLSIDTVFDYIFAFPIEFPFIIALEDINLTRSKYGKFGRDWLHVHFGWRKPETSIRII